MPFPFHLPRPGALVCGLFALAVPLSAQTVYLTGELLTNPGAESNLAGWTDSSGVDYLADDGSYESHYAPTMPHSGSYQFVAGTASGAAGSMYQDVSLTGLSGSILAAIDAGTVNASVSFWQVSLAQGGFDDTLAIRLVFTDTNAAFLGSASTASYSSYTYQNRTAEFALPTGTRQIAYYIDSNRGANGGVWLDAFVDDNSLRLSTVPEPAALALLAGLAALGLAWRRRSTRAHPHVPVAPPDRP